MNFLLNKKSDIETSDSPKYLRNHNNCKIQVFGDLIGAIYKGKIFSPDESFEKICNYKNKDSLTKFLRNLVGKCYVVLENKNKTYFYCSPSSSGLFYSYVNEKVIITDDESYIYKFADYSQVNEIALFNTIVCHQGLIRMPFSTPFNNIKRVVGGCVLIIEDSLDVSYDFYLMKNESEVESETNYNFNSNYKTFSYLFEGTLRLITDYYKEDLFLAKSGGIDSSAILAGLVKNNAKFIPLYIQYNGDKKKKKKTAKSLCDIYNINLDIIPEIDSYKNILNIKTIREKGEVGLGTVLGSQYLKINQKTYFESKKVNDEANVVTGQNLDSLYFIDTFAPGSNVIGITRFFQILNSVKKRIFFTDLFLSKKNKKWILRFWPFKVKKSEINKSFKEYLVSFITPAHEHVIPFRDNFLPSVLKSIEKKYTDYKTNEIVEKISMFYKKKYPKINNIDSATVKQKNHLIRVSKWFRFVQNTHSNYHNLRKVEKINRITPFSEGPLANYFLTYPLTIKDTFFIKRFCFKYFQKNSNHKFYNVAKKYKINILLIILRILYRKISKIKFLKKLMFITGIVSFKNKISNYSKAQDEYKSSINIYNKLISKRPKLLNHIKSQEIKAYLLETLKILEQKKNEYPNKQKIMELSRLVNLELFLNKNCK